MSAHPSQSGRVWRFGDNLNTDVLAPGAYMKFGIEEIARHCLEAVEPRIEARALIRRARKKTAPLTP